MAQVCYLCLTPDYRRPLKGLFVANPNQSSPYYQFWYNSTNGTIVDTGTPPAFQHDDTVGFAIELLPDAAHAAFTVDQIVVQSTIQNNPIGSGDVPAKQSEAFNNGTVPRNH